MNESLISGIRLQEQDIRSSLGLFKRKGSLVNPFYSQLNSYYSSHCCRPTDPACLRIAGPAFSSWAYATKMNFAAEHEIISNSLNDYFLWVDFHSRISLDAACCFFAYTYAGSASVKAGLFRARQMRSDLRNTFNSFVLDNLAHFNSEHEPFVIADGLMVENLSDYEAIESILAMASILAGESLC